MNGNSNATNEVFLDLQPKTNFGLLQIRSCLGYVKYCRARVTVQFDSDQR